MLQAYLASPRPIVRACAMFLNAFVCGIIVYSAINLLAPGFFPLSWPKQLVLVVSQAIPFTILAYLGVMWGPTQE